MASPKLAVPSSGFKGRGYRRIFEEGQPTCMSVTTALGVLDKPGLINWHVEQTALHAVVNVDELLSRSEEAGVRYLQYFSRRLKQSDLDDEERTVFTAASGVLSDLAELGDFMHDYIEADLLGEFPKDPWREDQAQMILAWEEFRGSHDIRVVQTEATVYGKDFAGTFDLIIWIDGKLYLVDIKTSRVVYDSHYFQLAALGSSLSMAIEVPEGTEGAVYHEIVPSIGKYHGGQVDSWWVEEPVPAFTNYGILRVRPDDYDTDGNFIPAHCELHEVDQRLIDAGFKVFEDAVRARQHIREFEQIQKEIGDEF